MSLVLKYTGISDAKFWGICAISSSLITIVLMCSWAQPNPSTTIYNQTGFLGQIDWDGGILVTHILVMTIGFFSLQVLGDAIWCFINNHNIGLVVHLLLQSLAIIGMGIGLYAAVKQKNVSNTPHLTTMHAWYGIFSIGTYALEYLLGALLGLSSKFKMLDMKSNKNMKKFHAALGHIALFLTLIAVITGIMEQFGTTGCYYVGVTLTQPDINPAYYYFTLPDACKIGNGMGIFATMAAIAAILSIHYRSNPITEESFVKAGISLPKFTTATISSHNTRESVWIVVHDKVYDCTPFLLLHPGGVSSIMNHAGEDVSIEFESIHTRAAWAMLDQFLIGELDLSEPIEKRRMSVFGESEADDGDNETDTLVKLSARDRLDIRSSLRKDAYMHKQMNETLKSSQINEKKRLTSLDPKQFRDFQLISRNELTADTLVLRFALPSNEHSLGLPVGQHVVLNATVRGESVNRSYTPITLGTEKGFFELLIKVYHASTNTQFPMGGKMSQNLSKLPIGANISAKGPTGHVTYFGNGKIKVGSKVHQIKTFVMLAAGTGITPMYQVMLSIFKDPTDQTRCILMFANRTEYDILLSTEIDAIVAARPLQFFCYHALSQPTDPAAWQESGHFTGRMNENMMSSVVPIGGISCGNIALLCGPRAFTEDTCPKALATLGYTDADIVTF